MLLLRQGLSVVLEDNAIQLTLVERSHGLNVATVQDAKMMRDFGFVLAVRADVAAEVLTHFPAQMKIAPVTRIRDLQLQLPGIGLHHARRAAPDPITPATPTELEKGGDLWKQMENPAPSPCTAGEFQGWTWNLGDSQPYGPVTYDSGK